MLGLSARRDGIGALLLDPLNPVVPAEVSQFAAIETVATAGANPTVARTEQLHGKPAAGPQRGEHPMPKIEKTRERDKRQAEACDDQRRRRQAHRTKIAMTRPQTGLMPGFDRFYQLANGRIRPVDRDNPPATSEQFHRIPSSTAAKIDSNAAGLRFVIKAIESTEDSRARRAPTCRVKIWTPLTIFG